MNSSGLAPAELQPVSIYVVLPAETDRKTGNVIPGSGGSGVGISANKPQRVFALNRREWDSHNLINHVATEFVW